MLYALNIPSSSKTCHCNLKMLAQGIFDRCVYNVQVYGFNMSFVFTPMARTSVFFLKRKRVHLQDNGEKCTDLKQGLILLMNDIVCVCVRVRE